VLVFPWEVETSLLLALLLASPHRVCLGALTWGPLVDESRRNIVRISKHFFECLNTAKWYIVAYPEFLPCSRELQ